MSVLALLAVLLADAHDRVVDVRVEPPETVLEHVVDFEGRLFVWTSGALVPALRVETPDGAPLAEGDAPLTLDVTPGRALRVTLAADEPGTVELHLAAAPESEHTRAAADDGRAARDEARRLRDAGRLDEARALIAKTLDAMLSVPGADASGEVMDVVWSLGSLAAELGDRASERRAWTAVLAHRERVLPPDDERLRYARSNAAGAAYQAGDLDEALALMRLVVASARRTLPPDDLERLGSEGLLGVVLYARGDLRESCAIQERVLAGLERLPSADLGELALARSNLGVALRAHGEAARARSLLERAVADFERLLPDDHPMLANVRANLALAMNDAGDALGASVVLARALEDARRALPPEHPDLAWLRGNLAAVLRVLGDAAAARELLEETLAGFEGVLPPDHEDMVSTRSNLAGALLELGETERACELLEEVEAVRAATLPEDHRDLLVARFNLAEGWLRRGDVERATRLFEDVLAVRERTVAPDHADVLLARENLVSARLRGGDTDGARTLAAANADGMLRRAERAMLLAPREARALLAADRTRLGQLLLLDDDAGRAFTLVETRRHVATLPARVRGLVEEDAGLEALEASAAAARRAIGDLVARADAEAGVDEVARLAAARDDAERALRRGLAARGLALERLTPDAVAAALPDDAAAVGFLRWGPGTSVPGGREDHLLAFVLRPDGALARVDLGPTAELEALVLAWRDALGKPVDARGASPSRDTAPGVPERDAGEELRRRLLAPVLAATGDATTLLVCPDDLVYLVPLDALPDGAGRVGDARRVVTLSSFAHLGAQATPDAASARLTALGGVDYGDGETFAALPGTRAEIDAVAALFDGDVRILAGDEATKDALLDAATGARFLHLATHGWFAAAETREGVRGLAPSTLCGLALAGANRGRDALGRAPGILTAEELATADLSRCDLAVLSACETNVGVRRAGLGIRSLQGALHAAGARTAITSLWKVGDDATRALMERFYGYLWRDGLAPPDALWRAKRDLRADGAPPRDWAGWVLSGRAD